MTVVLFTSQSFSFFLFLVLIHFIYLFMWFFPLMFQLIHPSACAIKFLSPHLTSTTKDLIFHLPPPILLTDSNFGTYSDYWARLIPYLSPVAEADRARGI